MKIKSMLSFIMAGLIIVSVNNFTVAAKETEKIYTLSELIEMDNEEFFKLDNKKSTLLETTNTQSMYEYLKSEYGRILVLRFYTNTRTDKNYEYYYTEKKLQEIIGDAIEYEIASPITSNPEEPYWGFLVIEDIDYCNNFINDKPTDDDFIYLTKVWYCINQIIEVGYYDIDVALSSNSINYGEANGDNKLTAADAAFIAKKLAEKKAYELPETADFNGDGEITALDCAKIAQFLAARLIAQAEGL